MNSETTAIIELPKYNCHKEVHALKIARATDYVALTDNADDLTGGILTFEDTRFAQIVVDVDWWRRFNPTEPDLGYYVVYADGYKSWSPTKAFEDGYTEI